MINIVSVLIICLLVIGLGRAWEELHTCHLDGCEEWTPESGPGRLCPRHRSNILAEWERLRADQQRRWVR